MYVTIRFYNLLFSTDKKYKGRKLKIKSYGFETYAQTLELTAKVPVGYSVINPNGTVGVGCYFEHLNKGNDFFVKQQYADAKTEYYLALECNDFPEEKVYAINPQDVYTKERVDICKEKIANLPRVIRGKVTGPNGRIMSDVIIKAEVYKQDKKGKIETDKKGDPKMEMKQVGKTDSRGSYEVAVFNQTKQLKFYKPKDEKNEYISDVVITNDEMEVVLEETLNTNGKIEVGTKAVIDIINTFNKK